MTVRFLLTFVLTSVLVLPLVAQAQSCTPQTMLGTTFALAWAPPVLPAGVTLQEYVFERQRNTEPWVPWRIMPATATTLVDSDLQVGHTYTYHYAVRYRTASGTVQSGWSSYGLPPPCVTVLAAPLPTLPPPGPLTGQPVPTP